MLLQRFIRGSFTLAPRLRSVALREADSDWLFPSRRRQSTLEQVLSVDLNARQDRKEIRPTAFCWSGEDTVYVGCERGELFAISAGSGRVRQVVYPREYGRRAFDSMNVDDNGHLVCAGRIDPFLSPTTLAT